MRLYPSVTSSTISQSLCQHVLLRGLNAHITDTMGYNCTFETATQNPIYDYLGSLHPPLLMQQPLIAPLLSEGVVLLNIPRAV